MKKSSGTGAKLLTILRSKGMQYLFKAEFPTDIDAPMGSDPISYNAEIGTLRLRQQNGVAEWRIVGGVLETTASSNASVLVTANPNGTTGYARTPGLAFKHRTAQNPIGPGPNETISPAVGWATSADVTSASNLSGLYFWTVAPHFAIFDRDTSQYYALDANTSSAFYVFTHVLRSAGSFVVVNNKLAAILNRGTESTTFPVVGQAALNRHPSRTDYMRIARLGGSWQSDFGIATTRLAGARSAGDTFTHEANAMWIEFTLTALPTSGNIDVDFRRQDANNCWRLRVTSAGGFELIEIVASIPTTRASIASCAAGDRLLCVFDGTQARLTRYRTSAAANSSLYSAVSTFTTQTSGIVTSLGTGGAISDIVTWPRDLAGEALAWISAL